MDISQIKKIEPIISKRTSYNYDIIRVKGETDSGMTLEGTINEVIKEINSNTLQPSAIFKCAAGHRPKVEGYRWKFLDVSDHEKYSIWSSPEARKEFLDSNNDNRRKIVAFDTSGNPIKGFENIMEALEWLKHEHSKRVDYKSIIYIAKNHNKKTIAKTSVGFQWRFYDELI